MSTTFMNLNLPTPTVTLGEKWAVDLNAAIEVIDSHDHSSGKGSKIPTAGLNINANLDFGSFKAFSLLSTQYTSQSSTLTGATNASSLYDVSGDLYWTNGSGVAIQLTSGGSISAIPASVESFGATEIAGNLTISAAATYVIIRVDTTASRSIDLPLASAVSDGRVYIIKDISGQALDNPITVNTQGSDELDGASSQILNSNYGSWMITGDGTDKWYIS